jgi:hypothetical protein
MKIINQTTDELMLKEGNASGIIFGIIFILAGIALGFYSHFTVSPALWVALGLLVVGIVTIFISSSITVDFSKTSGQITYQTKRLVGGKTTTYAIADVLRVETRKSWRMEQGTRTGNTISAPRQVLVFQSVMVFKDGQELPLDHQNNSSGMSIGGAVMMGGSGKEVAIANQVATFLGVPFQEIAPPSSGMGINLGSIGGIQL